MCGSNGILHKPLRCKTKELLSKMSEVTSYTLLTVQLYVRYSTVVSVKAISTSYSSPSLPPLMSLFLCFSNQCYSSMDSNLYKILILMSQ